LLFEVVFIALGLAMDCFAVAISSSIAQSRQLDLRKTLTMALLFGGFQAAMPLAGWAAGFSLRRIIAGFDHWVAFALLAAVGGKMIREAFRKEERRAEGALSAGILIVLAFATSIDAFAVGLSLGFMRTGIVQPAIVIGAVSFIVTLAGASLGRRIGKTLGPKAEVCGGAILIAIGLKILIEHLR